MTERTFILILDLLGLAMMVWFIITSNIEDRRFRKQASPEQLKDFDAETSMEMNIW